MERLKELKDTKGVIIIRQSKKDRQHNDQKKKRTTIHKAHHRKITIGQHELKACYFLGFQKLRIHVIYANLLNNSENI
jgi:hypothetical protein